MGLAIKAGILIVVVLFVVSLVLYGCRETNSYRYIATLNKRLLPIRNKQNKQLHMTDPAQSGIPWLEKLDKLIKANHDSITREVQQCFKNDYYGFPMDDIDEVQHQLTRGSKLWSPIWVRFLGHWAAGAVLLPTLQGIVSEVGDDILILHVSVFQPGTSLRFHRGPSMGVWRYHYGLIVPDGDLGLQIGGQRYRWQEKESIMFDDTITHRAWNKSSRIRCVIFADVVRAGPDKQEIIQYHLKLQRFNSVKTATRRLKDSTLTRRGVVPRV